MVIAPKCNHDAYGEGDNDWLGYASTKCIKGNYYMRNEDSGSADLIAYIEGVDDDDGDYDYAPAA
jgi:hypothetical protein